MVRLCSSFALKYLTSVEPDKTEISTKTPQFLIKLGTLSMRIKSSKNSLEKAVYEKFLCKIFT
jgi:hypothetical protein